ncbi:MAG: PD-(D/E)XK nuclease family protein [Chloroflexi bacterium]|nr:PD-(D/E)XK nuclease family protein [Chloroflexota bacterium]MYE40231.1 PD-(D/E)XK nuclease family protein [Chloroflexota bacterium]
MVNLRSGGPYIWATWLPRLLSGESSCEWAGWFKARHDGGSWVKRPSDFDQTQWLLNHTALLNEQRREWEGRGYEVFTEGQNSFNLRGKTAVLAGKPDLVARRGDEVVVIDAKTGKPGPAHAIQVAIYQYALPRALKRYRGLTLAGQVAYQDHQVEVPVQTVDKAFVQNVGQLITRLAAEIPARQVPSLDECRYCEITSADCPVRVEGSSVEEGVTEDF